LLGSGYGFIRVLQRAPAERVGEAINSGAAFGFPPGIALAAVVLADGFAA
jgi:hypothetical protein